GPPSRGFDYQCLCPTVYRWNLVTTIPVRPQMVTQSAMGRLRQIGYSVGIVLIVFIYLSLPTLRQLYGPVVNIPVYAAIALLAGGTAWVAFSKLSTDSADEQMMMGIDDDPPVGDEIPDSGKEEIDIDEEVETLREEN
ncbi:MAG: hypothetical protein ABEH88_01465, partial [Halobacteriales archaeon]